MTQKSSDYLMMPGFTAEMSLYNTRVSQSLSAQESFESTMVVPEFTRWCPPGPRTICYKSCVNEKCGDRMDSGGIICRNRCWNKCCDIGPSGF